MLEVFGGGLFLDGMRRELVEEINKKYPNNKLPRVISIKVSMSDLPEGKIAMYDKGRITIHPKALGDRDHLRNIIKHELIHAAFGERRKFCSEEGSHHWGFEKMAIDLGLPKKYWD